MNNRMVAVSRAGEDLPCTLQKILRALDAAGVCMKKMVHGFDEAHSFIEPVAVPLICLIKRFKFSKQRLHLPKKFFRV